MQSLLLLSILLATILVPLLAARDRSAVRSLKKTLFVMFWLNADRMNASCLQSSNATVTTAGRLPR